MKRVKKRKDVVIIANFCGNLDASDNNRFLYLAHRLEKNCDVELITSDFNHMSKKHRHGTNKGFTFKVTLLHESGYSKNISLRRFLSHWIWGRNVKRYLRRRKKPDVVYCAVPSLTAAHEAGKYCGKRKIKFLIDIQDLWPQAFQMVFDIPLISDLIYFPLKRLADGIYSRADEIIAVSQTYVDIALKVNKKCRNGYSIYLGTDLETFDQNVLDNPIAEKTLGELWMGYCGTLGSSYDLICVMEALKMITERGIQAPKFMIMGDGPRRAEFEDYAKKNHINCKFWGLLPYAKMCGVLKSCDMVVNPITCGAAQSIINKHADYAASGLPVLNTQECAEYRNLIDHYQMGVNCKNNDSQDLAQNIVKLLQDKPLRERMGTNARKCAEQKFDRRNCYKKIIDKIEK